MQQNPNPAPKIVSKDQNPELAPNPKIMSQNQNPELAQNHIFRWIFDQILYFSSIIIKILARVSSVNKNCCHIYYYTLFDVMC